MEEYKKPFKSFDEQIDYLESLNMIINDRTKAKKFLKQYNYFIFINNYDKIFLNKCGKTYIKGTTIEMLYSFYKFDTDLKELLLKYLFHIEKNIKTLIAYYFSKQYGCSEKDYLKHENYYDSKIIDILQQRLNTQFFINYKKENNHIPLWVLINDLSFGEIAEYFYCLHQKAQNLIMLEFPFLTTNEMECILRLLAECRNICAHNKPFYCFESIHKPEKTEAHAALRAYNKDNTLINLIVSFKYLLYPEIFNSFFYKLKIVFSTLEENLSCNNNYLLQSNSIYQKIINNLDMRNLDLDNLFNFKPEPLSYYKGKCPD